MCIGSNWVNEAQDLKFVTKFEDFPNSLIPNIYTLSALRVGAGKWGKRPGRKRSVDKD